MEKIIELKNLTKNFDDQQVLKGINLDIHHNEFLTLLGPSGCGKTTTLRIIAGFEEASSGEVLFDGMDISKIPAYKREINTVFQKYALFPHMNVFDNVAFGLNIKKMDKAVIKTKVERMLSMVGLANYGSKDVTLLSGGQQQRVAIARALVNEPKVLLLDEPLGALDARLRKEMQTELKKIQKEVGITFVFVTHDQEEALSMSDTVVVMNEGTIQQIGTPIDIYNEPENRFVAGFIGMPRMNTFDAQLQRDPDGKYAVQLENAHVVLSDEKQARLAEKNVQPGRIVLGIRPEHIMLAGEGEQMIHGTVDVSEMMGSAVHLHLQACGRDTIIIVQTMSMQGATNSSFGIGQSIAFTFGGNVVHVFDPETGKNLEF